MNHSLTLGQIAPAIVAAQAEFRAIGFDSQNPDFRSSYTSLDKIVETIRPVIARHGLAVIQGAIPGPEGHSIIVETRILHSSGEWIDSTVVMPLVGRMKKGGEARHDPDPQAGGSAASYGRRYGLCAAFSLVTGEDDDGNAASRPQARKQAPRPSAEPSGAGATTTGEPADRLFKGKPLGSIETDELKRIEKWARKPENAERTAALLKDIVAVLADRALGTDTDSVIARMHAAMDKQASELPFGS